MSGKAGPRDSRQKVIWDYCDKEFERRNLKDHTSRVHGNHPVKERLGRGQKTISLGVKSVAVAGTSGNNNEPAVKKARRETEQDTPDLNDSLSNYKCYDCDFCLIAFIPILSCLMARLLDLRPD